MTIITVLSAVLKKRQQRALCVYCRLTSRLTLRAVDTHPARAAPALPVVGVAAGSIVTVTQVETIRTPVTRGARCRRREKQ